jgi:hypothetical protein
MSNLVPPCTYVIEETSFLNLNGYYLCKKKKGYNSTLEGIGKGKSK